MELVTSIPDLSKEHNPSSMVELRAAMCSLNSDSSVFMGVVKQAACMLIFLENGRVRKTMLIVLLVIVGNYVFTKVYSHESQRRSSEEITRHIIT